MSFIRGFCSETSLPAFPSCRAPCSRFADDLCAEVNAACLALRQDLYPQHLAVLLGFAGGTWAVLVGSWSCEREVTQYATDRQLRCEAFLSKKCLLIAWVVAVSAIMIGRVLLELPRSVVPPPYTLCASLTLCPSRA